MGSDRLFRNMLKDGWPNELPLVLSNHWNSVCPSLASLQLNKLTPDRAGAGVAALFYTLFPDNPIVLPILGWLFSLPCFYVITQMPDYGQASRFTLLAYVGGS